MPSDLPAPDDLSDPGDVAIGVERTDGAVVLHVVGELDMLTTPKLDQALLDALQEDPAVVVIDLTRVSFMSSTAMASIVQAHRTIEDGTELRVVAGNREIVRPLELVGLDDYLRLYPTLAEALGN